MGSAALRAGGGWEGAPLSGAGSGFHTLSWLRSQWFCMKMSTAQRSYKTGSMRMQDEDLAVVAVGHHFSSSESELKKSHIRKGTLTTCEM